jgi:CRISPR type III-A-associated protein Csm2
MAGGKGKKASPEELITQNRTHFGKHYLELLDMENSENLIELNKKLKEFIDKNVKSNKGVSSSQLRRLFDEVQKKKEAKEVQMLRPLFAYTIARQPSNESMQIMLLIDDLAEKVEEDSQVYGFRKFMETLIAYHKYFEVIKQ